MSTQNQKPEEWIKEIYLARKERNASYSMRAFARDLKVSQAYISLLWNGKRPLSKKAAMRMLENLKMPADEIEKYGAIVEDLKQQFSRAKILN